MVLLAEDRALVLGINKNGHEKEEQPDKSTTFHFHGGGKAVVFSSDELQPYISTYLHEKQYQFLRCASKKKEKQTLDIIDGDMLCRVPLTILVPKTDINIYKSTCHFT